MKTVGIVADDYKIAKFRKELEKKSFSIIDVTPFVDKTSTIRVSIKQDQVNNLKKLCQLVELHFKRSN